MSSLWALGKELLARFQANLEPLGFKVEADIRGSRPLVVQFRFTLVVTRDGKREEFGCIQVLDEAASLVRDGDPKYLTGWVRCVVGDILTDITTRFDKAHTGANQAPSRVASRPTEKKDDPLYILEDLDREGRR